MPVGNLGADVLLSMADHMFGRALATGGHLLWARDARLPALLPPPPDALSDLDFQPLEINNRRGGEGEGAALGCGLRACGLACRAG